MIDVQCAHCGRPVPHFAHARAKYCSEHCKREARPAYRSKPGVSLWHNWKTRRKALKLPVGKRETPSVADLVQRDGLDCHICLSPIDYTLHGHHDDALSVDHLIPVSDIRSSHELENLKLAHRRCNRNRNNHLYNEKAIA